MLLFAVSTVLSCSWFTGPPPPPKNVLLITIDTLRADHLGSYGDVDAVTPNMDRLAEQGVRFEQAIAAVPVTLPSHLTILTGVLPPVHGVHSNGTSRAPDELTTLAERLKTEGFRTAAVVSSDVLSSLYGIDQGFDVYRDDMTDDFGLVSGVARHAGQTTDIALELLNDGSDPWFVWAHYFDPHMPYDPPSPFDEQFQGRAYDGEIAYVDQEIGRLLEGLRASGAESDTLIVVTADHGEGLGEHGEQTHGTFIYNSTLRVPLIFSGAGVSGKRVVNGVSSIADIVPTLLDLLGLPTDSQMQGQTLVPAIRGSALPATEIYSESRLGQLNYGWSPLIGLRRGDWTYIRAPIQELYAAVDDPGELNNLAPKKPVEVENLDARLDEYLASLPEKLGSSEANRLDLDTDDRQRLLSLGYVSGGIASQGTDGPDPKTQLKALAWIDSVFGMLFGGQVDRAIQTLRDRLATDPDNGFAVSLLAEVLNSEERDEEAADAFLRLVELAPFDPQARLNCGNVLARLGRLKEARDQYLIAVDLFPGFVLALENLGSTQALLGELSQAQATLLRAVELAPDRAESRVRLGDVLGRLGQQDEADSQYRRALEIQPDHVEAKQRLAGPAT